MPLSHQITCAGDDCDAWSITAAMQSTDRRQLAVEHRARLAAEGWTDVEGRDYCPALTPA